MSYGPEVLYKTKDQIIRGLKAYNDSIAKSSLWDKYWVQPVPNSQKTIEVFGVPP